MKTKITSLFAICIAAMIFTLPIHAVSKVVVVLGNQVTGSTNIVSTGGGGYKQARVETKAQYAVDTISVSGRYYIVNGYTVGNPSNSNKWFVRAYATLTYDSSKKMGCDTTHRVNSTQFYTSTTY